MTNDLRAIRAEAERQLAEENFNNAVAVEKERIRIHRPWWHSIFPYYLDIEITIRKRK
jgi:hypothetical protein